MYDQFTNSNQSRKKLFSGNIQRWIALFYSASRCKRTFWILSALSLAGVASAPLHAAPERTVISREAEICDRAAHAAANGIGVPIDVLLAITRTETGRTKNGLTEPWPWAVNMEGRGLWFDTQSEAMSYVFDHFRTGARSFDIGCFQINYRWHGSKFTSIEQMFDPYANARYAAEFLKRLFDESGDWRIAAGAFHSRTPKLADRYIRSFDAISDEINTAQLGDRVSTRSVRHIRNNRFPLLQSGSVSGIASLVPLAETGTAVPVIILNSGYGNW